MSSEKRFYLVDLRYVLVDRTIELPRLDVTDRQKTEGKRHHHRQQQQVTFHRTIAFHRLQRRVQSKGYTKRPFYYYCSYSLSSLAAMSEQQPPSPLPPSEQQQQQPQIKQEPPSQQQEQEQQQQPPPPPPVPAPSAEPAPAPTSTSNTVTPDPATASEPVTVKVKEEPDAPSAATLDASIEKEDIDMGGTGGAAGDNTAPQASGTSTVPAVDGAADAPGPAHVETEVNPVAPAPTPTKKDASLREFLGKMDEYAPIVSFYSLSLFSWRAFCIPHFHLTPSLPWHHPSHKQKRHHPNKTPQQTRSPTQ